jgi:hypothetical protein
MSAQLVTAAAAEITSLIEGYLQQRKKANQVLTP